MTEAARRAAHPRGSGGEGLAEADTFCRTSRCGQRLTRAPAGGWRAREQWPPLEADSWARMAGIAKRETEAATEEAGGQGPRNGFQL